MKSFKMLNCFLNSTWTVLLIYLIYCGIGYSMHAIHNKLAKHFDNYII